MPFGGFFLFNFLAINKLFTVAGNYCVFRQSPYYLRLFGNVRSSMIVAHIYLMSDSMAENFCIIS